MYFRDEETVVALTSFLVRFVQHAQRHQKDRIFIRRRVADTLWGALFNSGILQKTQSQKISSDLCQISSEEPGLSDGGNDYAYAVYDDSWNRTGREHKIFTNQWCFQKDYWVEKDSPSDRSTAFSLSPDAKGPWANDQRSHTPSKENIS